MSQEGFGVYGPDDQLVMSPELLEENAVEYAAASLDMDPDEMLRSGYRCVPVVITERGENEQTAKQAVERLLKSDRGRLALRLFRTFLTSRESAMMSLDAGNWAALATLGRYCGAYRQHDVMALLDEALERGKRGVM